MRGPQFRLCAIVDVESAARAGMSAVEVARACLAGGAHFLQVRGKQLSSAALLDTAEAIVALGRAHDAIVIVNDRADVAVLAGAAGVHVGQDDLSPSAARAIVGPDAIVGLSTHTDAQLRRALEEPIGYVAVGPVFPTTTKATGYEAVGLEMVRRAARSGRPVVAIGGITIENAASVIEAGAASVAVIGALLAGGDPERNVRNLLDRL